MGAVALRSWLAACVRADDLLAHVELSGIPGRRTRDHVVLADPDVTCREQWRRGGGSGILCATQAVVCVLCMGGRALAAYPSSSRAA